MLMCTLRVSVLSVADSIVHLDAYYLCYITAVQRYEPALHKIPLLFLNKSKGES